MAEYILKDRVLEILHRIGGCGSEKETFADGWDTAIDTAYSAVKKEPSADVSSAVLCKDCRWAKPYERMDGKTGYYCHFCGHSIRYGTSFERVFTPLKDSDDFCSYGESRTNE